MLPALLLAVALHAGVGVALLGHAGSREDALAPAPGETVIIVELVEQTAAPVPETLPQSSTETPSETVEDDPVVEAAPTDPEPIIADDDMVPAEEPIPDPPQPKLASIDVPSKPKPPAKALQPPPQSEPNAAPETAPEAASVAAAAAPAPPKQTRPHASAGIGLQPPAHPDYLDNPPPAYPTVARRRRFEGIVVLLVSVDPLGRPARISVADTSGHAVLDEAAVRAVGAWRFVPARIGNTPVAADVRVPVRFTLRTK